MTTDLTETLAAIQERVSAATEGPLENVLGEIHETGDDGRMIAEFGGFLDTDAQYEQALANAEFFVHARTDVEWMARALQAVVAFADEYPPCADCMHPVCMLSHDIRRAIEGAFQDGAL